MNKLVYAFLIGNISLISSSYAASLSFESLPEVVTSGKAVVLKIAEVSDNGTKTLATNYTFSMVSPASPAQLTFSMNYMTPVKAGGPYTIRAVKGDKIVEAQVSVVAGTAYKIISGLSYGNNQEGLISSPLDKNLKIQVVDRYNNSVKGTKVEWTTDSGVQFESDNTLTDKDGISSNKATLGAVVGTQYVIATVPEIESASLKTYKFTLTAKPNLAELYSIAYSAYPSFSVIKDQVFLAQPSIVLKDGTGNIKTIGSHSAKIEAFSDYRCSVPATGTLSGITEVMSTNGYASFSGLKYSQVESIYLKASVGSLAVCSPRIIVNQPAVIPNPENPSEPVPTTPKASKLSFNLVPSAPVDQGVKIDSIRVISVDSSNVLVKVTVPITLSLSSSPTCSDDISSKLGGTLTKSTSQGLVTFSDIIVNSSGSFYLKASSDGLNSACSTEIKINPVMVATKLSFAVQPSEKGKINIPLTIQPVVQQLDQENNLFTAKTGSVLLGAFTDAECTTQSIAVLSIVGIQPNTGTATFQGIKFSKPGTYYLRATSSNLISACSSAVKIADPNIPTCTDLEHLNVEENVCELNKRSCSIPNGQGFQNWDIALNLWGECGEIACNEGYRNHSNSCIPQLKASVLKSNLVVNQESTITVSGGIAPYTYSVISGVGQVSTSGSFVSPTEGTALIQVTDGEGVSVLTSITVKNKVSVSQSKVDVIAGKTQVISPSGGYPPYSYAILAGSGSVNSNVYTAGTLVSESVVSIRDSEGNFTSLSFNILPDEPQNIETLEGNNQVLARQTLALVDLKVRVKDRYGNIIKNQQVNFSFIEGTGSLILKSPITDSSGEALISVITGLDLGVARIKASVLNSQGEASSEFNLEIKDYTPNFVTLTKTSETDLDFSSFENISVNSTSNIKPVGTSSYTSAGQSATPVVTNYNMPPIASPRGINLSPIKTITEDEDVWFDVSISLKNETSLKMCSVVEQNPFRSEKSCSDGVNGLKLKKSELDSGTISVKAEVNEGGPVDFKVSNSISSNRTLVQQVSNIAGSSISDNPRIMIEHNGFLYFSAITNLGFNKLFRYCDGSVTCGGAKKIEQLSNINSNANDDVTSMASYSGSLYIVAKQGSVPTLFVWDNTSLKSTNFTDVGSLILARSKLYFSTKISGSYFLIERTESSFNKIGSVSGNIEDGTEMQGKLYLNTNGHITTWDGTTYSRYYLSDANSVMKNLIAVPTLSAVFFHSSIPPSMAVYRTFGFNGSTIFSVSANPIYPSTISGYHDSKYPLIEYKGKLYFNSTEGKEGQFIFMDSELHTLYRYDGSTLAKVMDINNGVSDDYPTQMKVYNNNLYIRAMKNKQSKLFRYDESSLTQITNINNGHDVVDEPFGIYNNALYFSGYSDGVSKLFRVCDRSAGCIN